MMKECRECKNKKPLDEFYRHPQMSDGYLNFCKECYKLRVSIRRVKNIEMIREYDRNRPNKAERYLKAAIYNKNRNRKSNAAVGNAIRAGRLFKPNKCSDCNGRTRLEAHHEDYSRPLDVVWLCSKCHGKRHRKYDYEKLLQGKEL